MFPGCGLNGASRKPVNLGNEVGGTTAQVDEFDELFAPVRINVPEVIWRSDTESQTYRYDRLGPNGFMGIAFGDLLHSQISPIAFKTHVFIQIGMSFNVALRREIGCR